LYKPGEIVRKDRTLNISTRIFGLLFVFVILLFFVTIPIGNSEIFYMTFGTFIGILGTVGAFFFGSSSGSKEKCDGIMRVLGKLKQVTNQKQFISWVPLKSSMVLISYRQKLARNKIAF